MTETSLTLPFIMSAPDLSYPAEVAIAAFLAELQRKKSSFLREKPEKIASLSKVYYPYWIAPAGNGCLIIDGLCNMMHEFSFQEPTRTAAFIEEIKRNSVNPAGFVAALEAQAKTMESTMKVRHTFPSLLNDADLLGFFSENLQNGIFFSAKKEEQAQIPAKTDQKTASQTSQALINCLRTVWADAKGLQYAIDILNEEVKFYSNAVQGEITLMKTKCDQEISALKPTVEENVKKLVQKRDKALATLQKSIDRKMASLDRKRERLMRKLQTAEQRRDAAHRRRDNARKKDSSSGSFALKKYEKDVDKTKKEVKSVTQEMDRFNKEGNNSLKLTEEGFQKAIMQEEGKLTQINAFYAAKTDAKQNLTAEVAVRQTAVTSSFKMQIDELKHVANALWSQVSVNWKTENPNEIILVQLPLYLVKYSMGEEERFSLISPLVATDETSVLNGFKKMLALSPEPKLKAVLRNANKRLQETLTANLVERLESDAELKLKITSLCRVNNVIDQNNFAQTLNDGLDEIERRRWMTSQEAQVTCKRILGEEA